MFGCEACVSEQILNQAPHANCPFDYEVKKLFGISIQFSPLYLWLSAGIRHGAGFIGVYEVPRSGTLRV